MGDFPALLQDQLDQRLPIPLRGEGDPDLIELINFSARAFEFLLQPGLAPGKLKVFPTRVYQASHYGRLHRRDEKPENRNSAGLRGQKRPAGYDINEPDNILLNRSAHLRGENCRAMSDDDACVSSLFGEPFWQRHRFPRWVRPG